MLSGLRVPALTGLLLLVTVPGLVLYVYGRFAVFLLLNCISSDLT